MRKIVQVVELPRRNAKSIEILELIHFSRVTEYKNKILKSKAFLYVIHSQLVNVTGILPVN